MLMTGSSFLLTPQSGEKLIINGFAIIGSFMFLLYFANTLPFHSTEVPVIGEENLGLKRTRFKRLGLSVRSFRQVKLGKTLSLPGPA